MMYEVTMMEVLEGCVHVLLPPSSDMAHFVFHQLCQFLSEDNVFDSFIALQMLINRELAGSDATYWAPKSGLW